MYFKRSGIITWLLFIAGLIFLFLLIFWIRGNFFAPTVEVAVEEVELPPTRGFAKPQELSQQDKDLLDNRNIEDALVSSDIAGCEKLFDEALKQKCIDNIRYAQILRSGNENDCELLFDPSLKQRCYNNIYFASGTKTYSAELCNKISDEGMKQRCLNQIQSIIVQTATTLDDCDQINDKGMQQRCEDNVVLTASANSLDEEGCDDIQSELLKQKCKNEVAQTMALLEVKALAMAEAGPTTNAEKLADCDDQECKDQSNYDLAYEQKDLSYCGKIVDTEFQQECITVQTETLDAYYLRKAIATKNKATCEKIIKPSLLSLCESSI